ncbi:VOC family protein [Neobacillus vireti]|uniref:Glyoxalase family protein n=1 Tax=Neobacillus vireti LMG 21834 TaxID=1131730 RepID=A0AB94IFI0_9BACI|nr:VOC family protein [Neobacillus vireti]ETI65868.1 glyoxalase family protein [Neobacillus vireti LMG 21834]KLT17493.1 glyoxalase [Neobacillus vireti]
MIKKIEHTAIIVKNMEESINYYSNILGFKVRERGSNERREMTFIYLENNPSFEIELIRDLEQHTKYSPKGIVNHLAFAVDNMEDSIKYFTRKGLIFINSSPNVAIDGAKTIFFEGPNGELLQLVERAG